MCESIQKATIGYYKIIHTRLYDYKIIVGFKKIMKVMSVHCNMMNATSLSMFRTCLLLTAYSIQN